MNIPECTVTELAEALAEGATVVDVREPHEYHEHHIHQALNLPLTTLPAQIEKITQTDPVYLICRSGQRSLLASQHFCAAGKHVINVRGGMIDWLAANLPVTTDLNS